MSSKRYNDSDDEGSSSSSSSSSSPATEPERRRQKRRHHHHKSSRPKSSTSSSRSESRSSSRSRSRSPHKKNHHEEEHRNRKNEEDFSVASRQHKLPVDETRHDIDDSIRSDKTRKLAANSGKPPTTVANATNPEVPKAPPPPRISKTAIQFGKPGTIARPGIHMKLNVPKPKTESTKKITVASAFNNDSDEEVEEMPPECKMRMRNIGRDTPTSSGPNSFGKTKQGFIDSKKLFEKSLREACME